MAALNTFIYQNRDEQFFLEHFMPGTAVGDPTIWVKRASEMGETAMVNLTAVNWDVSYGATALQAIDVFRAKQPRAPIVLYFHGGYWCAYDKANYRYIPGMLVPQGVTTILANYDLCPNVTLDEIVSQTIECIAFVYQHAAELGGDPERIFLVGSSAGGQLAAMALAHDFGTNGLPRDIIKGTVSITGVHRLEPVLHIPTNEYIRIDEPMARRNTTLDKKPVTGNPVIVAVGGEEPSEWIRMSVDYDTMLREEGVPGELLIIPRTHHYSITQTLADPGSELSRALLNMIGLA